MVLAAAGMWPGVLEQGGLECERAWRSLVMEEGDSSVGRAQAGRGGWCAGSTGWEIPVQAERRLVGVCWEHRLGLAGRGPGCVSSAQGLGA